MSKRGMKIIMERHEAKSKEVQDKVVEPSKLIAKKDFVISHNDYFRKIKAGDDVSDVPSIYLTNLKTEQVI